MNDSIDITPIAKNITDLSGIGIDLGFLRNNIGNFSLLPTQDGHWFAYFRAFQYIIHGDRQGYYTSYPLEQPDHHQFCILNKDFGFVEKIDNLLSLYYEDPVLNKERPYLEDGRFVKWGDNIYLTSAVFYQNNGTYERFGTEVQQLEFLGADIIAKHHWNSCEQGL